MAINRQTISGSVLISAVALAAVVGAIPASAQMNAEMQHKLDQMLKMHPEADKQTIIANMQRVHAQHLQKCYGINAVAKNDCASGAHSCAGQATRARDASAFVLIPQGDCQKIAGGSLKGPA